MSAYRPNPSIHPRGIFWAWCQSEYINMISEPRFSNVIAGNLGVGLSYVVSKSGLSSSPGPIFSNPADMKMPQLIHGVTKNLVPLNLSVSSTKKRWRN